MPETGGGKPRPCAEAQNLPQASSRPKSLPPCGGKVSRREPRRMRGPPPPVPVTEHARDRRGQAPPLRRGPKSPAGFQPPQKPSPHRGEGVAARAVTDEGSSFPRTSHRACQRQAGTSPAPAQRPNISRRLPAAPKAFPPCGGKVSRREPRRMRGPPSPVPPTGYARGGGAKRAPAERPKTPLPPAPSPKLHPRVQPCAAS